jgi:hypothetical protein
MRIAVRALGLAAVAAIAVGGCGRAHKPAPRATVDNEGGDSGRPMPPAGTGGTANGAGTGGESGEDTGDSTGSAGRSVAGGTGGSAGAGVATGGTAGAGGSAGGETAGAGAGGASGGGAAAGAAGATSGPMPVPTPPVWKGPLPSECTRTDEIADAEGCTVSMQCSSGYVLAFCSGHDIPATCGCETEFGGIIEPFEADEYSGIGTCRTIAQICSSGEELDLDGPEECRELASSSDATSCSLHQSCANVLESGNVDVRFLRERSIACLAQTDGTVLCACGLGPQRFELTADAGAACAEMIEQCDTILDMDPEVPGKCQLDLQSTFEGYCRADAICTHATMLDGGVTVLQDIRRDVQCRGGDEPGSTCICGVDERYVTFHRDTVVEGIEDCNRTLLICTPDTFDFTGGRACEPTDEGSTTNQCWASLLCDQRAMLGDEAVEIRGRMTTSCIPSDDGWACECRNDTRGVTVNVTAEDSSAACVVARTMCADAIPVFEWSAP